MSFYLVGGDPPQAGGTTTAELPNGIKWLIAYGHDPGKPMCVRLFGLTADYIGAVEIELRGETRRAIVGDNGVFYEVERCEPDEVSALILQDQLGGRQRVALHPHAGRRTWPPRPAETA